MSTLQDIINSHADNMVARHNQIEEMVNDQAATRANEIAEKAKAINDSFEQTGTALGSAAGAFHLGRSVYKAYKAKGLKGAAKRLAEKAKQAKGDLKNIKDDDEEEGDEPTAEQPTGPTGTDADDPDEVGDRLDNLVRSGKEDLDNLTQQATDEASQPTEANEEANQAPSDPAAEQPEAEAAEPTEINLGGANDPETGNLNFQMGSVDEPEDLQVARWSDMAERVSSRNAAKGLDIEGNPLPEGVNPDELKPAERVLADVSKRAKVAPQQQPKPQGGDEETNPQAVENQPAAPEPAPEAPEPTETDFLSQAQKPQGKLFQDAPAPSDEAGQAADQPLAAESTDTPSLAANAGDEAAQQAAKEGANISSKIGSQAFQKTGTLADETLSKVGSGLSDALPETLEAASSVLDFIPVVGEVAGLGMGLYGLIESIIGKKPDTAAEAKLIPEAPSASGIDPQAAARSVALGA